MKKIFISLALLINLVSTSIACTTFFINHNGQMVFGRNYDWVTGSGMVCTNHRGLLKTSDPVSDGETITWTSKYGSITFNQYGKEFPTGGMNEKGLVVELMWLDETRFPSADKRPAIGVLQWIQYQLDNSATVNDVLASDKILRITTTSAPLHYLVADAEGNVATIEFLEGKMTVHKGSSLPFPVLTNSTYSESKELVMARHATNIGGANNSLVRFVTACNMVNQFTTDQVKAPAVDHAFNILGEVAQGSHTKWSIVYDLKKKEIHFKTLGFTSVKTVRFSAFDLSCNSPSMTFDMNQQSTGDISSDFLKFSNEINKKILDVSVEQSKNEIQISDRAKQEALDYPGTIKCNGAANKPLNNNP